MNQFSEGQLIGGRYAIRGRLGIGGFAEVYEAWDESLERPVAVKVMLTADLTDDDELKADFVKRFQQEATLAARVDHPNVVQIYDFGELEDTREPFIVMEKLNGHDLDVELVSRGPLHPERAVPLFLDALLALALAHDEGIVHKDLKPSNLFLTRPQTPYERLNLLDFGVAHLEHAVQRRLTREGQVVGTPSYLPPEYATERVVTPALDVYQMGLILVEAMCGRPVVEHEDPVATMFAHVRGDLDIPDAYLDSKLGPVLATALALDHNERFPNALEFHEALRTVDPASIPVVVPDAPADADRASGRFVAPDGSRPQTGEHRKRDSGHSGSTRLMFQEQAGERVRERVGGSSGGADSEVASPGESNQELSSADTAGLRTTGAARRETTRAFSDPWDDDDLVAPRNKLPYLVAGAAILLVFGAFVGLALQPEKTVEAAGNGAAQSSEGTERDSTTPGLNEAANPELRPEPPAADAESPAATGGVSTEDDEAADIVEVEIRSDPMGATVFEGGREMGKTPVTIEFFGTEDAARSFVLKRRGYRDTDLSVSPASEPEVDVLLERRKPRPSTVGTKTDKPAPSKRTATPEEPAILLP